MTPETPEILILRLDVTWLRQRITYWESRADLDPKTVCVEVEALRRELAVLEKNLAAVTRD